MITENISIGAGQTVKFIDVGDFLRILNATAPITVRSYKNGQVLTESVNINSGYAEQFVQNFDAVEVYSATAQDVQIVIRLGSAVYYDQAPNGNVTVTAPVALDAPTIAALAAVENGAAVQSRATVTNINQLLIPANATRRYLLIQNNDTSAVLRVTLDGVAATASAGFRVQAGGVLEIPNYQANAAVNCMMETASAIANNVEFLEA